MSAKKARFETFFRCSWNRCSTRAKCKRSSGSIWDGISIVYLGSSFLLFETRGRSLFRVRSDHFRIRSRGGCKKGWRYSKNSLRNETKRRRRRIVIVGRICAAIKRGHLSRWRVVCEILLDVKHRAARERERGRISWGEEIVTC